MSAAGLAAAFGGDAFFLIAGPCVLEDDTLNLRVGEALAEVARESGLQVVFKASFDKANRSKPGAARGPGLDEGLKRLDRVAKATGLPVLTDIHEPQQAAVVAEVCSVIQIPAFLCRQTDLLVAAGATGALVNVKKGQWMSPEQMRGAVEKVAGAGAAGVAVTERGTFFGYGDLVVDMRSFHRLRQATGSPVIFDGTHSVQRPGQADGASGGDPDFIRPLVLAATAAGADGLFLEVHPDPVNAPSDSTNMLRLESLGPLLRDVLAVREAVAADRLAAAAFGSAPA